MTTLKAADTVANAFDAAMKALPLIAILRGITPAEIDATGDLLVEAGFRLIEVPLTSPDAFASIARLVKRIGPDIVVGRGRSVRFRNSANSSIAGGA